MEFIELLKSSKSAGKITAKIEQILHNFYESYKAALSDQGKRIEHYSPLFAQYLTCIERHLEQPFIFPPYHRGVRLPFDYFRFGKEFIHPLILFKESKVEGLEYVDKMVQQLARGDNVVLFGNHQTEPDPQVISLLLDRTHPKIAEEIIFVAGSRVTTDPLAIPFSMGCNLLCIYSKKHIEHPPEKKEEKLLHNQRVMQKMRDLFSAGGKCVYVAPSGGRDRKNEQGRIIVAPFDPQSIEIFRLIAKQSKRPTHFYPLALATHHLLPPPNTIEKDLGERRHAQCTPVHLMFGDEINMETIPVDKEMDKKSLRHARAHYICSIVQQNYASLMQYTPPPPLF